MRSALLSQQAFDGGRRGLCDLGIVRGLHAGNTNAAEFCPRKRIGTPPSTATRSMLSSAGRSLTLASTTLVGLPIKAAVCAFPPTVATEAGREEHEEGRERGEG